MAGSRSAGEVAMMVRRQFVSSRPISRRFVVSLQRSKLRARKRNGTGEPA